MAKKDKTKWNKKYQNNPIPNQAIQLVQTYAKYAKGTKALDIACGMGRHSKYLASIGFNVDALDISSVAIQSLQNIECINTIEVDFDTYVLKEETYDLIVCTFFLKRSLFPQIIKALKSDGILIYETFVHHSENQQIPSNKSFLLEKGELEENFKTPFLKLYSKEYWDSTMKGYKMRKASLVVQKI